MKSDVCNNTDPTTKSNNHVWCRLILKAESKKYIYLNKDSVNVYDNNV